MRFARVTTLCVVVVAMMAGCQKPVYFPANSMADKAKECGALSAYDPQGRGVASFFVFADKDGRINRMGYSRDLSGRPEEFVDLDQIPKANLRHVMIILDGFGYDVVKGYYDSGHLRYFYPPSRVIAPYPSLTDVCLEDVLGYVPCKGMEAEYFDRRLNAMAGGSGAYLSGNNQPYDHLLQYRASLIWDALGYIDAWAVFGKEINDSMRLFRKSQSQELLAYYVSSAGVGTKDGAAGQLRSLERVEQLVNQIMWETRGLAKITITADHGHSYTPAKRIGLEEFLASRKWTVTEKLGKPRDVVYVRFGLETYASFCTNEPAELAGDLSAATGVDLASYVEKDKVVVIGHNGKAVITHKGSDLYRYEPLSGDVLKIKETLAKLTPDGEGYYRAGELLAATATAEYPAAMERLWRAHFGLVENPPDVIVSLEDAYYSGSRTFDRFVNIASTHGSLNRSNSTAFIMSTIAPLPPVMQSYDVPTAMQHILGRPFPMQK